MTLPPEAQAIVDHLRAVLGVPPCKLVIDMDDAGTVQLLQPTPNYRPARKIALDKLGSSSAP